VRVERTYIKERRKVDQSIRARPLDCNDGAARRVAPANGHDPKLRSESCLQVSLPKTLYGENAFEINAIQEQETETSRVRPLQM